MIHMFCAVYLCLMHVTMVCRWLSLISRFCSVQINPELLFQRLFIAPKSAEQKEKIFALSYALTHHGNLERSYGAHLDSPFQAEHCLQVKHGRLSIDVWLDDAKYSNISNTASRCRDQFPTRSEVGYSPYLCTVTTFLLFSPWSMIMLVFEGLCWSCQGLNHLLHRQLIVFLPSTHRRGSGLHSHRDELHNLRPSHSLARHPELVSLLKFCLVFL